MSKSLAYSPELPEQSCGEGCCEESRSSPRSCVKDVVTPVQVHFQVRKRRSESRGHQSIIRNVKHGGASVKSKRPPQRAPPLPHPPTAGPGPSIHPEKKNKIRSPRRGQPEWLSPLRDQAGKQRAPSSSPSMGKSPESTLVPQARHQVNNESKYRPQQIC